MYYVYEKTQIAEFKNKKEALAHKDNMEFWYPENSYYCLDNNNREVKEKISDKTKKAVEYFHKRAEKANLI